MERLIKLKLLARLFLVINLTFLFLTFANSAWSKNFVKTATTGPRLTLPLQILLVGKSLSASEARLEPQRLFSLLNLDTPGMKKVKVAVEAGDFNRTEKEMLEYKGRHATQEGMAIADDALKHIFGGRYVSRYLP